MLWKRNKILPDKIKSRLPELKMNWQKTEYSNYMEKYITLEIQKKPVDVLKINHTNNELREWPE